MQEVRDLLVGIDGDNVDLDQMRADRRVAKYERVMSDFEDALIV